MFKKYNKGAIKQCKPKKDIKQNGQKTKRTKGSSTLNRKIMIEQYETH